MTHCKHVVKEQSLIKTKWRTVSRFPTYQGCSQTPSTGVYDILCAGKRCSECRFKHCPSLSEHHSCVNRKWRTVSSCPTYQGCSLPQRIGTHSCLNQMTHCKHVPYVPGSQPAPACARALHEESAERVGDCVPRFASKQHRGHVAWLQLKPSQERVGWSVA